MENVVKKIMDEAEEKIKDAEAIQRGISYSIESLEFLIEINNNKRKYNEQIILGMFLIIPKAIETCALSIGTSQFSFYPHRFIYQAILDVYNLKKAIKDSPEVDIVSVSNRLDEMKRLDFVGGRAYINELAFFADKKLTNERGC